MKNVHILPTDKPSRLFYNVGGALLFTSYESRNGVDIYITSDEEIKEGDWFYLDDAIIVTKYINVKPDKEAQKIILTTNQDLIKDGVQAIDDTFLEWFVKNPSCEEVEVDKNWNYPLDKSWEYKIITPKEEQKQHLIDMMKYDEELGLYEESKQETLEKAAADNQSIMKKQTALDWFFSELERMQYFIGNDMLQAYKQAKEMDKQQMCKFAHKCHNHYKVYGDFKIDQYYNETFNSEK